MSLERRRRFLKSQYVACILDKPCIMKDYLTGYRPQKAEQRTQNKKLEAETVEGAVVVSPEE